MDHARLFMPVDCFVHINDSILKPLYDFVILPIRSAARIPYRRYHVEEPKTAPRRDLAVVVVSCTKSHDKQGTRRYHRSTN